MYRFFEMGIKMYRKFTVKRGIYSQYGQDTIIENFFQSHPPRTKRFVDVGSFDGITYSNVRALAEKGWEGICIEPVPKNFTKLEKACEDLPVVCENCACGAENGKVTMHVSTDPSNPDYGSDVATIHERYVHTWDRPEYNFHWTTIEVPIRTLEEIVTANNYPDFDLLCIDAEGHDLEVLKGLDFNKHRPQFVVAEVHDNRMAIRKHMKTVGYKVFRFDFIDEFYTTS